MIQRLSPIYSSAWRAAVVLLTIDISMVSVLRYVTASEAAPAPIVANAFATPFLVIHVIAAVIALLVGPIQFVRSIRGRWPMFHRMTGRIYVAACVVGAPTGFVLALGASAGPIAGMGFAIPAVLTLVFTWLGWRAAVERRIGDHREWMLRSYAVVAGAITLRLLLPASMMLGFEFFPAYRVISWLSWSINLALVEYHIRRKRYAASTPRASTTTVSAPASRSRAMSR